MASGADSSLLDMITGSKELITPKKIEGLGRKLTYFLITLLRNSKRKQNPKTWRNFSESSSGNFLKG